MHLKILTLFAAALPMAAAAQQNTITRTQKDGFVLVTQTQGPSIGYSPQSGARIIIRDGLAFKSFSGQDTLLPYEDWRLPAQVRAADLASRMTVDQIAGLMLYSPQNKLPMKNDTYGCLKWNPDSVRPWQISDSQRKFLLEDNVRHVLLSEVESPEAAARWNNAVQALAEAQPLGIPANNSSDPRHSAFQDAEFSPGAGGQLSLWSNLMGLACTFDTALVKRFGQIASAEYRALGLATALSPQADLGTDPRWYRFHSTFGNDTALVTDLIRAYCEGFQTSPQNGGGWGTLSVNTMVKHWPGGGSGEGGRDAHYGNGKYAVYPGGNYADHMHPFVHGAFKLPGATAKASAVMPYYTVSYNRTAENVGNSFNRHIIQHQLRDSIGYDGVVCTDWVITDDPVDPGVHWSKPWGVEHLSVGQRHYRVLQAGCDQFGGNNKKAPVIEAYNIGCAEQGEKAMRDRFELSAMRLLLNSFRPGLFENPYVDVDSTVALVGNPQFMDEGYQQQLKSVVMLKNHNKTLPAKRLKVYVPDRNVPDMRNFWGSIDKARTIKPVSAQLAEKYYDAVDNPADADMAIVFLESPKPWRWGYDPADKEAGGNGYIPISLQYHPYTASNARAQSIAADSTDVGQNRSYRGKTGITQNECDIIVLEQTRAAMPGKPIVAIIMPGNPPVLGEIEPLADAILMGFSVQNQAYLDLIFGKAQPSGLLPFEMPASMDALETHCEDRPHDIQPYTDADGNTYRFAFGLDFDGPISDARTARYAGR